MNEQQAHLWLSEPRFHRFLRDCSGDHDAAVALYEWHAELTTASFRLIHHFEVLLRNAVDGTLRKEQPQIPVTDTWLLSFDVLRPGDVKRVITAMGRLEKSKRITRGRVVAALSFAFWASLFGKRYEELWRQRLRLAFPAGDALTRKDLSARMKLLQHFRNRVAHHDSLLSQDVPARLEDMLAITAWIDPAACIWLEGQSDALAIARTAPTILNTRC